MPFRTLRRIAVDIAIVCTVTVSACGGSGLVGQQYQDEEELYLQLDG